MDDGIIIHYTYVASGIEVCAMRLCGVERIRAYDTASGRYAWSNIGNSDAMLQRVDSTNIRDSHEEVYQNLLKNNK